ncbi:uracil-DNA glycosylase family protein [Pseudomaricurvus sp. HS19]|uniref:uracil-DNA glycosylase family protein n=1 Tax=Pseudomaricurvus sp. HS19 TaxID=2692626 RepID=UPI0013687821|nr:uracil-DNA glycosylase family protein [Pseudomaricurvus sp. HS19]MYM63149.1 uracil-DNA glycosylase family protein [Pseudomaricurvus sp. HS19]
MSTTSTNIPLHQLLNEVQQCRLCADHLPLGPRPVVQIRDGARLLIIGQAPGTRVHASGIPWNDPSGDRLRRWLGIERETFYDDPRIAIMPMGFCYPGKGRSGDLPPRPECAPQWHQALLQHMPELELTLCIGQYAQNYYLRDHEAGRFASLTERVRQWQQFAPDYLPLPHPSPRNIRWFNNNPWFEDELVPWLQQRVSTLLQD